MWCVSLSSIFQYVTLALASLKTILSTLPGSQAAGAAIARALLRLSAADLLPQVPELTLLILVHHRHGLDLLVTNTIAKCTKAICRNLDNVARLQPFRRVEPRTGPGRGAAGYY